MAYTDEYGTTFTDDKKRLIKFSSVTKEYSIPSGTEEIASSAFEGNQTLKVLHIPSTVRLVQDSAFYHSRIDEIHYGGDIEQWLRITWKSLFGKGYTLYFNETDLVESVIIPDNISVIKEYAFYYCTSLRSVIFNKNITSIEKCAFNKSGLKGILSIPKSCREIKERAFFCCDGITKVKIPEATKEIEFGAFSACSGLQNFVVSTGNVLFFTDGIGLYSFVKGSGSKSVNKQELKLIALASGSRMSYRLHEHTASIMQDACCLDSIPVSGLEISRDVSVEQEAFRSCSGVVKAPLKIRESILHNGLPYNKFKAFFVLQDALITQGVPEAIYLNPFRVLGVYCNASQREIQSNATRIKRLLEIGKQPSFKTDFNEVLPPLERTPEMVDMALSQISQPKEKLAYALLWFAKPRCERHEQAEDLLRNQKFGEACELLIQGCGDFRVMIGPYISLCRQHLSSGYTIISLADKFYIYLSGKEYFKDNGQGIIEDVKLEKSLLEEICGENFAITEDECQILLFDKLMTFVDPIHLWACADRENFSEAVVEHLFSMSLGKNISRINAQIAAAKSVAQKDSRILLKAAKELKDKTEQDIASVYEYLPPSDARFISVHDALANQILQSAIDGYNIAGDYSAVAREVYDLMLYAGKLAKGDVIKKRCEENAETVKEVVDELPPADLEAVDKKIFAAVTHARNSADTINQTIDLLKELEPHLYEINLKLLSEKNAEVAKNIQAYFTKVCTIIANVCLNKIIEDVNNSSIHKNYEAWPVITALNQLPLDEEFKNNRYDKNVEILIKNIANGFFGITRHKNEISYDILDIRPEQAVWQQSRKDNNYQLYIKRFPKGRHIEEAKRLQAEIDRKAEEQRQRQEERRRQQDEQRKKEQKVKREGVLLNWLIGALVVLIAFELVYLFWGWDGVASVLIVICIIVALIALSSVPRA